MRPHPTQLALLLQVAHGTSRPADDASPEEWERYRERQPPPECAARLALLDVARRIWHVTPLAESAPCADEGWVDRAPRLAAGNGHLWWIGADGPIEFDLTLHPVAGAAWPESSPGADLDGDAWVVGASLYLRRRDHIHRLSAGASLLVALPDPSADTYEEVWATSERLWMRNDAQAWRWDEAGDSWQAVAMPAGPWNRAAAAGDEQIFAAPGDDPCWPRLGLLDGGETAAWHDVPRPSEVPATCSDWWSDLDRLERLAELDRGSLLRFSRAYWRPPGQLLYASRAGHAVTPLPERAGFEGRVVGAVIAPGTVLVTDGQRSAIFELWATH